MKGKCRSLERISALPQDTIEKILTHMPIRDALRTSILSRKWRNCWRSMPKLVFDDSMITVSSGNKELDRHKFVKAIFHVLLLHRGPILEFGLFVDIGTFNEVDQIILHLSMTNSIKKFVFGISGMYMSYYLLPCSLFSLQGLEHLDLSFCEFQDSLLNKGFGMLKSLRFYVGYVPNDMFFKFLTNCPLLERFTWIGIELTECEWVELFKCLPSVQVLEISKLYIKHLAAGSMPHKLPISLPNLRILDLSVCFLELSTVLCVVSSSPNLEKIKVEMCWDHNRRCPKHTFENLLDNQDYTGLHLDHLKELEIRNFRKYTPEMEFVMLIMAKSPVLKKARIELHSDVSVDEELKMFRDVLRIPFLRASPITIERPK